MDQIDMGFVEECEPWKLESRFFPNKVGGKPAWLDLKDLPSAKYVECKSCKNPCIFLCQIYAPYENNENAFHRTIFIFICKNDDCCKPNENGNLQVLRSQLSRDNKFYPFEPPNEQENWRPDINSTKFTKVCQVCGLLGPNHCGKCKLVNYCCRQHQIIDWKAGHDKKCSTDNINNDSSTTATKNTLQSILFPEYELIIESDVSNTKNDKSDVNKEEEEMKKYEKLLENGEAGTLQTCDNVNDDLLKMAAGDEDKVFIKFQNTIRDDPDQVLRYNRGGVPLYITSKNEPNNIPNCEKCNGERQFEFQIMPQLLNYLNLPANVKSLDWGTLLVFTCKNSCNIESGYCSEYIWKQDIL
ncbi:hypothetical protein PV327_009859 [Microctonus hyperodae]|uniref:MYND-type domain-containing protein n=1 Tax=Microctonus hyperodae TaxID=165561 RepID=A0AA39F1V0_MICHY|nr:hypothetical protein PV327_009859 [Microctonus hyperodae]